MFTNFFLSLLVGVAVAVSIFLFLMKKKEERKRVEERVRKVEEFREAVLDKTVHGLLKEAGRKLSAKESWNGLMC